MILTGIHGEFFSVTELLGTLIWSDDGSFRSNRYKSRFLEPRSEKLQIWTLGLENSFPK